MKPADRFAEARRNSARSIAAVDALVGVPAATSDDQARAELARAVAKVRRLPMHPDVSLVLDCVASFLGFNP